jgi:uncharacterized protein DUF4082
VTVYRLWPSTDGAPTDEGTDPINLGTEIILSATGWVTALHMWRATLAETGPVTGAVYNVVTGVQVAGTSVTYSLSGTGWQTATLVAPVQLTAGVRYIAVVHHTDRYAGTGSYWTSGPGASGITNGILSAPPNSAVTSAPVGQGRYDESGTIAAPTSTFSGGGYWADLSVTDEDPAGSTASGSATSSGSAVAVRLGVATASGSASGAGSATGIRVGLGAAEGIADGTGSAIAIRVGLASAVGTAVAAGTADATRIGVASTSGSATAGGSAAAIRIGIGTASGGAVGTGIAGVDGSTASGSAVGSGTVTIHPLIRRPRRGVIHRP